MSQPASPLSAVTSNSAPSSVVVDRPAGTGCGLSGGTVASSTTLLDRQKGLLRSLGWGLPLVTAVVSGAAQEATGSNSWYLSWPGLTVLVLAGVSATTDLMWRKIPNWITYPACAAGVAIGTVVWMSGPSRWTGVVSLGSALLGLVVCFSCMLFPYRASGGGAGDVKLAAAYGTLLGWQAGLSIIVWSYMAAGLGIVLRQLATDQPWLLPKALFRWIGASWLPQVIAGPNETQAALLSRPIPLAGAFAVGLTCVLCGGNLFGS